MRRINPNLTFQISPNWIHMISANAMATASIASFPFKKCSFRSDGYLSWRRDREISIHLQHARPCFKKTGTIARNERTFRLTRLRLYSFFVVKKSPFQFVERRFYLQLQLLPGPKKSPGQIGSYWSWLCTSFPNSLLLYLCRLGILWPLQDLTDRFYWTLLFSSLLRFFWREGGERKTTCLANLIIDRANFSPSRSSSFSQRKLPSNFQTTPTNLFYFSSSYFCRST